MGKTDMKEQHLSDLLFLVILMPSSYFTKYMYNHDSRSPNPACQTEKRQSSGKTTAAGALRRTALLFATQAPDGNQTRNLLISGETVRFPSGAQRHFSQFAIKLE